MKVILLTDIPKVGNRYDVKELKDGYAINVLISKGLAEMATPHALGKLASKKAEMENKRKEEEKAFESLIASIDNTTVTILAKANDKGHLFKSISASDVAKAIKESSGVEVDEHSIIITGHIKEVGSHKVKIKKGNREGKCEIIVKAKN
jgi:large subunit ribosomal protein L9